MNLLSKTLSKPSIPINSPPAELPHVITVFTQIQWPVGKMARFLVNKHMKENKISLLKKNSSYWHGSKPKISLVHLLPTPESGRWPI